MKKDYYLHYTGVLCFIFWGIIFFLFQKADCLSGSWTGSGPHSCSQFLQNAFLASWFVLIFGIALIIGGIARNSRK